jgi:hypothetical protein
MINRDGAVTGVKTISAHPDFETYVLEALKQWRFKPSDREHMLQVTCSFELTDDKCEGTVNQDNSPVDDAILVWHNFTYRRRR